MELEPLCQQLGIDEHIPTLSEWRDELLRAKAEEMQLAAISAQEDKAAALTKKDEEIAALKAGPAAPVPGDVTKLTLMRRLDALGKWSAFKTLLSQLPEIVQDAWTLAQSIRADDPLFVQNAPAIKAYLELTDEEFDSLLE